MIHCENDPCECNECIIAVIIREAERYRRDVDPVAWRLGWMCPICGAGIAPDVRVCGCVRRGDGYE